MDTICTYNDTRDEVLVAYLYNDIDPAERAAFDAHLVACAICRRELDELSAVRTRLAQWAPPQTANRPVSVDMFARSGRPRTPVVWQRLGAIPAWAQVAAAMLFLGISVAVANISVTYDRGSLTVSTGWMKPPPAAAPSLGAADPAADPAPWRADLAALERQLRADISATPVQAPAPSPDASQEAVLRRVRSLIEASEQKQQRELALRIAEVDGHVQAQRIADLRNIDRNLTAIRSNTGVDMLRLYNMANELAVKVSQTR